MFTDWISFSALLAIQFGFAALLGAMVSQARLPLERGLLVASGLLYLGASLALPLTVPFRIAVWIASGLLFAGFLNTSLSHRAASRLGWLYLVFAMALILTWSIAQAPQLPILALGTTAALAGVAGWYRSQVSVF